MAGFPGIVRAQTSTVRIAASSAATQADGYFADQLGLFKQAGITATITATGRGSETLQMVARGDIDMASATPQAIANAIIHDIPIRIVAVGAVYVDPPAVGLYVAKDSTIKSPADLKNTTVAVNSLGDSQTLGVWQWMADNKVDPSSVKIVEVPFSAITAALAQGDRRRMPRGTVHCGRQRRNSTRAQRLCKPRSPSGRSVSGTPKPTSSRRTPRW